MAVNNRTPTFLGDLRAQVGAAQLGVRRLKEVLDALRRRHGARGGRRHHRLRQAALPGGGRALARRRLRVRRLRRPRPAREAGHPRPLQGDGAGRATSPSTSPGSDDRPEIQAYSTFGNTRGYVVAQLASMMDPTIPKNEGFFDSIDLIVPKGCCLNPPDGPVRRRRARTIPAPRSARRSRRRSSRWCPSGAARRSTRWACRP